MRPGDPAASSVKGRLFMIAVPIGNLGDLSPRARETLANVRMIAAEDTRTAGLLLQRCGIDYQGAYAALHRFSEASRANRILSVLSSGDDVAVISEAGTPGINDPGALLASLAACSGYDVLAVPGPSAITSALSIAGFEFERFLYHGYFPRKKGDGLRLFQAMTDPVCAHVFLESPKRIFKTLSLIPEALSEEQSSSLRIALCREMTKMFEETMRGTYNELLPLLRGDRLKGEFTVVALPGHISSPDADSEVERIAEALGGAGIGERAAVEVICRLSEVARNEARRIVRKGKGVDD